MDRNRQDARVTSGERSLTWPLLQKGKKNSIKFILRLTLKKSERSLSVIMALSKKSAIL